MDTYKLDWTIQTSNEILAYWFPTSGLDHNEVLTRARDAAHSEVYRLLEDKANTQGATVNIKSVNVGAWFTRRAGIGSDTNPDDWSADYLYHHNVYALLYIHVEAEFECDQIIVGSPVAPWMLEVLAKIIGAIVVIVVAYFAVQAIKDWLIAMTTTTSKITKVTVNPDGSTTTTTEDVTTPNLGGIGEIFIVILVLGVVLIFAVYGIPQKQGKSGRRKK